MNKDFLKPIEKKIGYTFKNKELAIQAFVHSSYANENSIKNNERLEFLGDSVLGFVVAKKLFDDSSLSEGQMTIKKARAVSGNQLSQIISQIGLDQYLLVSKNTAISDSMRENLFEALVAAVYLDGGLSKAEKFILQFDFQDNAKDYKSTLQQRIQTKDTIIEYKDIQKVGSDNSPEFEVGVFVNSKLLASGRGGSKKQAGQDAAKKALEAISKQNKT